MDFKKYSYPLLILILFPVLLAAQSDQLQREIRIAEGILSELFSENMESESPFIAVTGNRITSEYIPGYGVHFVIGDHLLASNIRLSGRIAVTRTEGGRSVIEMKKSDDDESEPEPTRESIEEKLNEYLTQYAPLMQSLPENESIRLSTGLRAQINQAFISLSIGERSYGFPKLTKWVSGRDLQQLRTDRISEQQFLSRVQSADLSEATEARDYNIFNSILESSVRSANFEHLRVRTGTPYIYLPGFGVQFNINVSSPGSGIFSFVRSSGSEPEMNLEFKIDGDIRSYGTAGESSNTSNDLASIRNKEIDSIRISAEQSLDSLRIALDDLSISVREIFTGSREEPNPEELENEKSLLYDEIKRTITEYGSTLSSLPDDEMLIISIHWSGRNTGLPQRTYLRIRKSDVASAEPFIQEISRR